MQAVRFEGSVRYSIRRDFAILCSKYQQDSVENTAALK